jgi:acyl-CoA thioesterase I
MLFNFKKKGLASFLILLIGFSHAKAQEMGMPANYLESVKQDLQVAWPKNHTINLVFHGHSVPTGYMASGVTDRLNSYPFFTLKLVNDHYPYSVVNIITTSIGGEQSEQGAKRFKAEVLVYKPDVILIDYALNDRSIGLERSKVSWEQMIKEALEYGTKVILLTPTPDLKEDITSDNAELAKHSQQIRALAKKYKVGLVDSYSLFKSLAQKEPLTPFMAQNNHINKKGHQFVADVIFEYFK